MKPPSLLITITPAALFIGNGLGIAANTDQSDSLPEPLSGDMGTLATDSMVKRTADKTRDRQSNYKINQSSSSPQNY